MKRKYRISDEFYKELCAVWLQGGENPIGAITERIRQEFNIAPKKWLKNRERLSLVGRDADNRLFEHNIGWLEAVAPGIVIFNPDKEGYKRVLLGLLKRSIPRPGITSLFILRLFSQSCCDSLTIYPSSFPNFRNPWYKICPAWISWNVGAGMGETYQRLGIDPDRWNNVLKPWLDKWLPPGE